MFYTLKLSNLLFLDIETVPESSAFQKLDDEKKELWEHKSKYQRKEEFTAEEFYDRAGIWAEFGKIVCISVGYFAISEESRQFRIKSFYGDEKQQLLDFKGLLETYFNKNYHLLCAHNGKEFDFPYIARRMVINGIQLPEKLNLFGKKPWEVAHIDTMELWKFGDYKHYTSLKLMANVLGVPSPKDDMDGSMVREVYYQQHDVERIVTYCELDVVTTAQVFLKLRNEEVLKDDEIVKL